MKQFITAAKIVQLLMMIRLLFPLNLHVKAQLTWVGIRFLAKDDPKPDQHNKYGDTITIWDLLTKEVPTPLTWGKES